MGQAEPLDPLLPLLRLCQGPFQTLGSLAAMQLQLGQLLLQLLLFPLAGGQAQPQGGESLLLLLPLLQGPLPGGQLPSKGLKRRFLALPLFQ